MKHIFTRLGFSLLTLALFWGFVPSALAQSIDVEFTPDPLFSGAELLPGDTMSGKFSVTNDSGVEQAVRMRAVSVVVGGLEDALIITVEGNSVTYTDTLTDFYDRNFIPLSNIDNSETHTYDVKVHFPEEKGNEYQGKTTAFDLCVGFAGNNENCVTSTDPGDGGDNTGGGGTSGQCAPGVDCSDDGDPDDDGTPNVTDPDDDNDGTPDETDPAPFDPGIVGGDGLAAATTFTTTLTGGVGETDSEGSNLGEEDETIESEQSQLGAAAFLGLPETLREAFSCLSIFLLILLVIWLLSLGLDALRDAPALADRERVQGRIVIIALLVLLSIVVAFIVPIPCVIFPLVLTFFACVAWFIYIDLRLRKKEREYIR